MARVIPDGWQHLEGVAQSVQRELETLRQLAGGLPDGYTVYHGIHWTTVQQGHAAFGEVDFVVVSPAGHLLLIEQKAGFLEETPEGLVKNYPGKAKSVAAQMARSRDAMVSKLRQHAATAATQVDSLLFCPHYTVRQPLAAGIAPERIVDARRKDILPRVVQEILPAGEVTEATAVHRFLRDILRLEPDVSALVGCAQGMVTRLSGGLAHWARQLRMTPFRLRVTGTAGSGKTQLALAEMRDASAAGRKALYVCFNRPLADHMAAIAPHDAVACTFHSLCALLLDANGHSHDYTAAGAFEALESRAASLPVPDAMRFDTVIIDEGQDWTARWRDLVLRHALPDARLLWLEDPLQNLYGRPPVELPGWVGLAARSNYRSPRPVARFIERLLGDEAGIEARSPIDSGEVEFITYADQAELLAKVKLGIKECFAAGFRKADVVVLSYHGREHSHLLRHDRLGDFSFRRFTGTYDLFQRPVYDAGDMLMESVLRFKGQSAPAVVLAEIDFGELDDKALRRLFVGATRATMKLVLVLSETAAARLLARLG